MIFTESTSLSPSQKAALFHLWNHEYPAAIAHSDIESLDEYLDSIANPLHRFAIADGKVVGWTCEFDRDKLRWFAIIVARSAQGNSLGKQLMKLIKTRPIYGWILQTQGELRADGTPYPNPRGFYEKLGFTIEEGFVLEKDVVKSIRIRKA